MDWPTAVVAVVVAMIAAVPPTIMAKSASDAAKRNGSDIKEVHLSVNSRMDDFLKEHGRAEQMKEELAGNQRRDDLAVKTRSDTATALAESNVNIADAEAREPQKEVT